MGLKVFVLEDELPVLENLLTLLSLEADIDEIISAHSVQEGLDKLKVFHPDIALLDISLPDGTSFELLEVLNTWDFNIIFTTSYKEYAIPAFKINAIDYLVKPLSYIELKRALDKARELIKLKESKNIIHHFKDLIHKTNDKKIVLNSAGKIYVLTEKDIVRCEADRNYSHIYLFDKRKIVVTKKIGEIEVLLMNPIFFRCHHSHLININYIKEIEKKDGDKIVLHDLTHVPLAKNKKQQLLDLLS